MDFRKSQNISVDIVVFGFDGTQINVLLSKRYLNLHNTQYPIIDDWKLTGQHIFKTERLDDEAHRILSTVGEKDPFFMHQFRAFGNPNRITKSKDLLWSKSQQSDPQTLSIGYYALTYCADYILKDTSCQWFPIQNLPELAFDHAFIIQSAFQYLKEKINIAPIIYHLLQTKFTLNSLLDAYETIYQTRIDNRNFRKKIMRKPYIVRLTEKVRLPNAKKPANLYMFSQDIYDLIAAENPKIIL